MLAASIVWSSIVCSVVLVAATAHAEHLPVRVYTSADGLASDRVERGTRDAAGVLWFATGEGVSRFDGHAFESFGIGDGLPDAAAHDVAVTRDGTVWVATDGGVAWLDPSVRVTRTAFHAVDPSMLGGVAVSFLENPSGALWVATLRGLFELERRGDRVQVHAITLGAGRQPQVLAVTRDPVDGSLWLGTSWGLVHRTAAGAVERYRVGPASEVEDRVFEVLVDRTGRLWIGQVGRRVLAVTLPHGGRLIDGDEPLWEVAARGGAWLRFEPDGTARRTIVEDSRGTIWIGTSNHVVRYDGRAFRVLTAREFQHEGSFTPCVEDNAGNLWFGGATAGVLRLAATGLVAFDEADGLHDVDVVGLVAAPDGPPYPVTRSEGHTLHRPDGARFVAVRPRASPGLDLFGWGWGQTALVDRDGRWWYPTGRGVARYPRVASLDELATTLPEMIAPSDGLPGRDVFRLYEDRAGDVWITTLSATGLVRWDRRTGKLVALGAGWPTAVASTFAEDAAGMLWIGYDDGTLVRVRRGAPEVLGARDRLPGAMISALLFDRAGRLWIATDGGGLVRLDDPGTAHPAVARYTTAKGLATDQALALVDDLRGRIYVGTTRGIVRLDPATGEVAHFTTADGLPNGYIYAALRDPAGVLWFGTNGGLARLDVASPPPPAAGQTVITTLAIAGRARPVAPSGERTIAGLELASGDDQLDISFTSPSFAGEPLRFQYRLAGATGRWTTPAPARDVHFAKLAPGSFRFEVRAVLASGEAAPPAVVAFAVLPPMWQRWWFIAACALALALAVFAIHRWRLAHLLAVERVRTRIATDLHDDLGASLSRISILSEVASRRLAAREDVDSQVGDIGRSARELVDVAADIVWSTDPRRDDLGSLVVRLRGFAGELLEARGIAWALVAPPDLHRIRLDPDCRRHLYLILKEAINNAARHSGATRVSVALAVDGRALVATVEDDGSGLADAPARGNGLANMRTRAADAGGSVVITSAPGAGTAIELRLPIAG
jgi:signal transduction histidine kinase/ligand-binding sensor domain-containing protein